MKSSKSKWLAYTVLVGLIPIASRLLTSLITKGDAVKLFAPADIIAFGLVLHISNVNEIEHVSLKDKSWKTAHNGASLFFIAIYSVLYAFTLLEEGASSFIDPKGLLYCSAILSTVSLLLSLSIFHRLSLLNK